MMKPLIIIGLICLIGLIDSSELKGDIYMKIGEYSVKSENEELHVQFPINWEENGSDVKVWMDLGGKAPKSPPVMPYESRRSARAKGFTFFGATWDVQSFVPGQTYNLTVKIEYVSGNGSIRVDSARLSVVVPRPGEVLRADRLGNRRAESLDQRAADMQLKQQKQKRTDNVPTSMGMSREIDSPPTKDLSMKADMLVRTSKTSSGTEYHYTIRNNDTDGHVVAHFQLEFFSSVEVTGTPKGWRLLQRQGGGGVAWFAIQDNGILSGKQLNGFRMVGSNNRTNIRYFLQGGGKVASGLIEGPGN
jgi:hypothetical protein